MNVAANHRDDNVNTKAKEQQPQPASPSLPKRLVSVVETSIGSLKSSRVGDDSAVIAAPPASNPGTHNDIASGPDHIPVVENSAVASASSSSSNNSSNSSPKEVVDEHDENNKMSSNNITNNIANDIEDDPMNGDADDQSEREGDESDYEYEDEDDVAFSGFLMSSNTMGATANEGAAGAPARIEEDSGNAVASSSTMAEASSADFEPEQSKKKWREPTRAAVNMSLRAEQETSGSKRRLAQDLYRIMNQDTEEAGFSLAPKSEDSMELWTIKLFQFDPDSNLAKDMMVLGINHIELEMKFPDQYPFEPPFVRVVKPRFKRQTGFVMNGALCMELLTKDGWNPINDIESVIVSIRSLLVVGDGRLQAAAELTEKRYNDLLEAAQEEKAGKDDDGQPPLKKARMDGDEIQPPVGKGDIGSYSASEAQSAYSHLSDYHKKKGWDTSGWWARKG